MKPLKYAIAAVTLIFAQTAWAQTAAEIVRDAVFSEVEKRIIGEHFGVNVQDMVQDAGMPDWAVTSEPDTDVKDRGEDEREDVREDDDEDGERKKGKKDKGDKGNGKGKGKDKAKGKSKGLPPGLAKRDTLPPGLQKQLEKNGRLPVGLAKRDLPDDLASKLPKRDSSQEVTVVDNDVVLIDKATGVILDVITDVVTGKAGAEASGDGSLANPGPQSQNNSQSDGAISRILKGIFGGN